MSNPRHEQAVANASELAQLKAQVSLVAYLESLGYERDDDKSTKQVTFLRRDSDKIVVRRGTCGYDTYAVVPGYDEKGSIVDYLQREGLSLDEVRVRLRELAGKTDFLSIKSEPSPVAPQEPDRKKVKAVWDAAHWEPESGYLLFRRIPPSTLAELRFNDCWRQANNGDVIFLHFDKQGPCGYERRNVDLKMFGAKGRKGLWCSKNVRSCARLVICEGPIDCLSYHALHVDQTDLLWPLGYVAFGGGMGKLQRELLTYVMRQCAERGGAIMAATDNDPAGDEYAETIAKLSPVAVERIAPIGGDWNDDLCWCVREEGETWN